jgi:NAD(P)-dependent dehydrogenase (short-subunit alcohol dehydrogenase family)
VTDGMQGKTVVATGATSGIGAIAVERLAAMGARIVFIARNADRAEATLRRLRQAAPGREHRAHFADLSILTEVKRVGAEIAASERRIDALVNNAGAMYLHRRVTVDGLEMTFALNHMSYFVLTGVLRERLIASSPSRIVNTASNAHGAAKLDFDDLQSVKNYGMLRAYSRSKLCNILFTRELARRLGGEGVTANCLHPGFVATRIADEAGGLVGRFAWVSKLFARSPEKGADTIVHLVSSPDVAGENGGYFFDRKRIEPSAAARDAASAVKLWERSEALAAAARPA